LSQVYDLFEALAEKLVLTYSPKDLYPNVHCFLHDYNIKDNSGENSFWFCFIQFVRQIFPACNTLALLFEETEQFFLADSHSNSFLGEQIKCLIVFRQTVGAVPLIVNHYQPINVPIPTPIIHYQPINISIPTPSFTLYQSPINPTPPFTINHQLSPSPSTTCTNKCVHYPHPTIQYQLY
jgi:hypothetical protein